MTNAKFQRTKPHVNIGVIGHVGHGKTALVSAITKALHAENPAVTVLTPAEIDTTAQERKRGESVCATRVEAETRQRHYALIDCPGDVHYAKNLVAGLAEADGALLVVDSVAGPRAQTREHLLLARRANGIVVALTKTDLLDDEERLALVERQVRELATGLGLPGDDLPVVPVSAQNALEGGDLALDRVREVVRQLDAYVPTPPRTLDRPFVLPVDEVRAVPGKGLVVTGEIETGKVKAGDQVELVGLRNERMASEVISVETFHKILDSGEAGDSVGLLLAGVAREDLARGVVVSAPGSQHPHTRFSAHVNLLSKEQGGRHTPISSGFKPQFHLRTAEVTGTITVRNGSSGEPGEEIGVTVELRSPVALDTGTPFTVREGGLTVGTGVVEEVLN